MPSVITVEEVDSTNLYIAISTPDLNFNSDGALTIDSRVNDDERFYAVRQPVKAEVLCLTFMPFIKM